MPNVSKRAASMAAVSMVAGSVVATAGSASSQAVDPSRTGDQVAATSDPSVDYFARNRNTSVSQRPRIDFEGAGLRAGAFLIYPRLELSAERNDNIYATASGEVADTILHARPELTVESDWSQNLAAAYVRGSLNRYADNTDENTEEFGVGGSGRIDVSRQSSIAFGADYNSAFEPRTAPTAPRNALEPTVLDTTQAYLSASRAAAYIKLSGRADWRNLDYEDGRTGLGELIEQDSRDRAVTSLSGRIDVAVSPETAFFFQATGNDRSYDVASTPLTPNRDSSGSEYLIGANFELGALVRGEIAAGYIQQNFDANVFEDSNGVAARVQLEWFPSELTTVSIAGGRTVEDTPLTGVGAFVSNNASLGIDHELLRHVILNARVTWGRDDYAGLDRKDTRIGANLSATYLVNRYLGVNANLSTLDTRSAGAARDQDFTVNRLMIALVAQF